MGVQTRVLLSLWALSAAAGALGSPSSENDQCSQYAQRGERWVQGCKKCLDMGLNETGKCLGCGKYCHAELCDTTNPSPLCATPLKYPELLKCTTKCYGDKLEAKDDPCSKYVPHGMRWVKGCKTCLAKGLNDTDKCLGCGKTCYAEFCKKEKPSELCAHPLEYPELMTCSKQCYDKDAATKDSCDKYDDAVAKKGCYTCKSIAPNKVDKCMSCGKACYNNMCKHNKSEECFKEAVLCAKKCLLKDDETLLV